MQRRKVLQLAALFLASPAPLRVRAQPAARVYRIGVLLSGSLARLATTRVLPAFQQGLRELGYIEGRNLIIEWRGAEGHLERFPEFVAEFVALKVDLIVAGTSQGAIAAKNATNTIPIVFAQAPDPVALGLVKSLARPGGNVTGLSNFSSEVVGKQLELLREVVPRISRIAVIHNPVDASSIAQLAAMRIAGATLKLQVRVHEVRSEADLESALRAIERERPEGLQPLFHSTTYIHGKRIIEFAAAQRLPAVYGFDEFVEAGGLMSYSVSVSDSYRRSAFYIDKILKGAKPADLLVQQPTKLELAVNLRTAKALGVKIPQMLLLRADRVIE